MPAHETLEQRLVRVDQQVNALQDVLYRVVTAMKPHLSRDARAAICSSLETSHASGNELEQGLAEEIINRLDLY
ncbi:hypothetical protein [Komagataeibacter saccharivorans]|uniref:hypothetical protein n=1 Tax=Komagataeibacter saccharivorans TaxID=265959 RepID=UPI0024A8BE83|nr:hypothetical protein [Komagataeibacter saccharivorans]